MIARYYRRLKIIRIFDRYDTVLCDIPYGYAVGNELFLDDHIDKIQLRRNNDEWSRTARGFECKVRWK